MIAKPAHVFDRDFEWRRLAAFAARGAGSVQRGAGGARLGVVSGRRRQGKTFLLNALVQQAGGLYFGATQATEAESLRLFADALAAQIDTSVPVPRRFTGWDEAITYLFSVGGAVPGPVVIDEFPYLSAASSALPSILQRELDRRASGMSGGGATGGGVTGGACLLLCGSAMSVMGRMLAGNAPLRGRAGLELVIRPFDFQLAARFWDITDPTLAVAHHAVVGGTPAYRRFANDDFPAGPADFDDWVLRTVLDPGSPLFREARYLLAEEVDVRDTALYHSVLGAVASGDNTRGGIANYIGRKAADIGHPLNVLEDCGLLRREPDVFRQGRSVYRIAEPLITFYQVVMRPRWGLLESGRAKNVWLDAKTRFAAQVIGPHFEQICREFAMMAPAETFGGLPGEVGAGVVADPARRGHIEIDVVVLAAAVPGEPRRVLSLGEAKWGETMGVRHAERLGRVRELLAGKGYDTRNTVIACFGGAGFDPALLAMAGDGRVLAVGPDELYADLGRYV